MPPEFCVTIIDDVNDPIALAQHGISPASPESLAGLLDAIANSQHTVTRTARRRVFRSEDARLAKRINPSAGRIVLGRADDDMVE